MCNLYRVNLLYTFSTIIVFFFDREFSRFRGSKSLKNTMYQGQFLTQAWKMCKGRLYTRQPQDGWAIKKSTEEKRVCMPRKPGFFKNSHQK